MSPLNTLLKMDRMRDNPDKQWLTDVVTQSNGILDLLLFVCPKFHTASLVSAKPETYMPTVANDPNDLFFQRIPKIKQLIADLKKAGQQVRLHILIGDNDAQVYIFPFLPQVQVDTATYAERQRQHKISYEERARALFDADIHVESLGLLDVVPSNTQPIIDADEFEKELKFFGWLFGEQGPYKGNLNFDETALRKMVELKFALYGAQGHFLQSIGGILLQTEGPGVWLQRTRMLRCTGAKAVPAIYPWIRKEEQL